MEGWAKIARLREIHGRRQNRPDSRFPVSGPLALARYRPVGVFAWCALTYCCCCTSDFSDAADHRRIPQPIPLLWFYPRALCATSACRGLNRAATTPVSRKPSPKWRTACLPRPDTCSAGFTGQSSHFIGDVSIRYLDALPSSTSNLSTFDRRQHFGQGPGSESSFSGFQRSPCSSSTE